RLSCIAFGVLPQPESYPVQPDGGLRVTQVPVQRLNRHMVVVGVDAFHVRVAPSLVLRPDQAQQGSAPVYDPTWPLELVRDRLPATGYRRVVVAAEEVILRFAPHPLLSRHIRPP